MENSLEKIEMSLQEIVWSAVEDAQCSFARVYADTCYRPEIYRDKSWVYDVEYFELAGNRLLNLGAGRGSLLEIINIDLEKEVLE